MQEHHVFALTPGVVALGISLNLAAMPVNADSVSAGTAGDYLGLKLVMGQKIGDVFSKTVSVEGGGIDALVKHWSGTMLFTVADASSSEPVFSTATVYEGDPVQNDMEEVRDKGASVCPVKAGKTGECAPYYEDTGPMYDAFLWGNPTGKLVPGMSWTVNLSVPWELGPPGSQTVTVVSVDPANQQVMLKREGSGEGHTSYDQYSKNQITVTKDGKKYLLDMVPGTTHWVGYTVFRRGLTVSDELIMTRTLLVSSKDFGDATLQQRQYTIFNQCPPELLSWQ